MTPAIVVEGLGKSYRVVGGHRPRGASYRTLRDTLSDGTKAIGQRLRRSRQQTLEAETFWALRDLSFTVDEGDIVGIIGRNGAGKSTLLKILSRITDPTEGMAEIRGRVGSLLEVGTGFHPELTGRENTYLNGAILGMTHSEIDRKFDEIVEFADVAKFIDTPVKHYSSGMHLRLGFAVAAHLEPEILIVDEVLAVGDAAFQRKCIGKMNEVSKNGRTILFVSHNMTAIQNLCKRGIWLHHGQVRQMGEINDVLNDYSRDFATLQNEVVWEAPATAPGDDRARLHRVALHRVNGTTTEPILMDDEVMIEVDVWNLVDRAQLSIELRLTVEHGTVVFAAHSYRRENSLSQRPLEKGLYRYTCTIPRDLLNSITYHLNVLVIDALQPRVLFKQENVLAFEVAEPPNYRTWGDYNKIPGVVNPNMEWQAFPLKTPLALPD